MVELCQNHASPDCFATIDRSSASELAGLARLCEAEEPILSTRRLIEFDVRFLAAILPARRRRPNFKTSQYVEALRRGETPDPAPAQNCFGGDHGQARCFGRPVRLNVEQNCASLNLAGRSVLSESIAENWNMVDRANPHPARAERPRQGILAA